MALAHTAFISKSLVGITQKTSTNNLLPTLYYKTFHITKNYPAFSISSARIRRGTKGFGYKQIALRGIACNIDITKLAFQFYTHIIPVQHYRHTRRNLDFGLQLSSAVTLPSFHVEASKAFGIQFHNYDIFKLHDTQQRLHISIYVAFTFTLTSSMPTF